MKKLYNHEDSFELSREKNHQKTLRNINAVELHLEKMRLVFDHAFRDVLPFLRDNGIYYTPGVYHYPVVKLGTYFAFYVDGKTVCIDFEWRDQGGSNWRWGELGLFDQWPAVGLKNYLKLELLGENLVDSELEKKHQQKEC